MNVTSGDSGPAVNATIWTLFPFAVAAVALRINARMRFKNPLGWDDYLMLLSLVLTLVASICTSIAINHGLGKHVDALKPEQTPSAILWGIVATDTSLISDTIPKMAVILLINKVLNLSPLMRCFTITMATVLEQCQPIAHQWKPEEVPGSCWNPHIFANFGIAGGIYASLVDLFFCLYPPIIVSRLNMRLQKKVTIMAIFGLSVFALFTTVYKTAAALPKLKHAQADFSWLVAQVVLWGIVESNVVIIAGSIPTWGWVLQSKGFEKFITLISHNSLWTSRRPERLPSHNGDVDNVSDKPLIKMMSSTTMTSETTRLLQELRTVSATSGMDEDARVQILSEARSLCRRLETPYEWVLRMTWEELGNRAGPAKSVTELADSSIADPALLRRIMRHLAGKGIIDEVAGDGQYYRATKISETLASAEGGSGIRLNAKLFTPVFRHVPNFLRSNGYKVPNQSRNGVFQETLGRPGHTYFDWIQEPHNKDLAIDFSLLMKFTGQLRKSWMDIFVPVDLHRESINIDTPILIDIGGGTGTDVIEFRRRYPQISRRIILQELPTVIALVKENSTSLMTQGIECQEHDFFMPQPVYGARIYYMGSVLHDWPKQDARKILRNIVPAMAKGYSTLLLNENVIPATGCHPHLSALDLTMMALFGSKERTEEDWRELLESEGLRLVAIHTIPSCLKGVLEVEKA